MAETAAGVLKREEMIRSIFSKLYGYNTHDLGGLIELITRYEKSHKIKFFGVMGSRLSFDLGGDYDIVFMTAEAIPPTVIQDTLNSTQIEVIVVSTELKPKETTYIHFQPISYPLLTNFIAFDGDSYKILKRLELEIDPIQVRDHYLNLALSILNINGYIREDFWVGKTEQGNDVRYDFLVLEENTALTTVILRAFKRCCLDFFPRAVFLHEFGRFPEQAVENPETIYVNMIDQLRLQNPEIAESLERLRDLAINLITSKLIKFKKTMDVTTALKEFMDPVPSKLKTRDLEQLIPDGLTGKRLDGLLGMLSDDALSKKNLGIIKLAVLKAFRDEAQELINIVLEKSKIGSDTNS